MDLPLSFDHIQISESSDTVSIESVLILSVPVPVPVLVSPKVQNKAHPRLDSGFSLGLTISEFSIDIFLKFVAYILKISVNYFLLIILTIF